MINKTRKYLASSLNLVTCRDYLINLAILGYYIGHKNFNEKYDKHLFILVNTAVAGFWPNFNQISQSDEFVKAYQVGHTEQFWMMLIIKLPQQLNDDIVHQFIQGNYSKMFKNREVEALFPVNSDARKVLTKDPSKLEELSKMLYDDIGKAMSYITEYDSRMSLEEEIYAYSYLKHIEKQDYYRQLESSL